MTTNIVNWTGEGLNDGSLLAPADWSGTDSSDGYIYQFRFIQINTSDSGPGVAQLPGGAGQDCFGVLQNAPKQNEACQTRFAGISKVLAGAAISMGAYVQTDSLGRAVTATSTNIVLGRCLVPANAAGDLITIEVGGRFTMAN